MVAVLINKMKLFCSSPNLQYKALLYLYKHNHITTYLHVLLNLSSQTLWKEEFFLTPVSGVPRGKEMFGGVNPSPPKKFRRPSKIVPNSTRLWKLLKKLNLGCQHPKAFRKKAVKF